MLDHKRELTYPAVIDVLADGEWHADEDLKEFTSFPHEWLKEIEYERKVERLPGSPHSFVSPPRAGGAPHLAGSATVKLLVPPIIAVVREAVG